MLTRFTPEQLADPRIAEADSILRSCVHCGFCTATCPTFLLRGDELDSPRGRIMLIKDMYEGGGEPTPAAVKHLDRCLTCLSCMTTCPSGVDYLHLAEGARKTIEASPTARPLRERWIRAALVTLLTSPFLFRWAMRLARWTRPLAPLLPENLRRALLAAPRLSRQTPSGKTYPAKGERRHRVALLTGCAQSVVGDPVNQAAIRLLTGMGCEVVTTDAPCCGALPQHLGAEKKARRLATESIEGWWRETAEGGGKGLDAVVIATSGCGSTIKDYAHLFPGDRKAAAIAALALDISEFLARTGFAASTPQSGRVAYHSACSLQHGQKQKSAPVLLLRAAGFTPLDIPEGHICCGSAGTYSILQPELATGLKTRKQANIHKISPDWVAAGNLGCILQIAGGLETPVVHLVQLLDWASGGPRPETLGG